MGWCLRIVVFDLFDKDITGATDTSPILVVFILKPNPTMED